MSADARAASGPGAAAEAGATAARAARPDRSAARLVLGIETSCDDCSAAVLEGGARLRSHLIAGQDVHRLYGGVVPELASRAHLELLPRLVRQALAEAAVSPDELTAIAVTRAPGLVGSLVVGVAFARAYGLSLGIPVVGVNHVEAHLLARARRNFLVNNIELLRWVRIGKPRKVPKSGPALARLAVPQEHAAAMPHDDRELGNFFIGRPRGSARNLLGQASAVGLAQLDERTPAAGRRFGSANLAAQLHQSLIEGSAPPGWQDALGGRP